MRRNSWFALLSPGCQPVHTCLAKGPASHNVPSLISSQQLPDTAIINFATSSQIELLTNPDCTIMRTQLLHRRLND